MVKVQVLLPTYFCSHLVPGIAMTATSAFFNSIITAYGLEHVLAKRIIVVFGEFMMYDVPYLFHSLTHQLRCCVLEYIFYYHNFYRNTACKLIVSTDLSQNRFSFSFDRKYLTISMEYLYCVPMTPSTCICDIQFFLVCFSEDIGNVPC